MTLPTPAHPFKPVLTLADLEDWPVTGCDLAVLGHPVAHSLSPAMHHAALHALAQTRPPLRHWRYHRVEVRPEDLARALPKLAQAGFRGLNLTLPHKIDAVPLVASLSSFAALAGAVNTLSLRPDGRYDGDNTDGFGLQRAIAGELGLKLPEHPAVLLGAGGAARAAAMALLSGGVPQLWLVNRSPEPLSALHRAVQAALPHANLATYAPDDLPPLPPGALVVNATSLGLKTTDPSPLPPQAALDASHAIYDMTYGTENALAQAARQAGARYADGLAMLVWQGQRALEIWTGAPTPAHLMLQAACHAANLPPRPLR